MDFVQIAIPAWSFVLPLRALTVLATFFTQRQNVSTRRVRPPFFLRMAYTLGDSVPFRSHPSMTGDSGFGVGALGVGALGVGALGVGGPPRYSYCIAGSSHGLSGSSIWDI
jgi:hypothetical protein